jgi:hypothetical protein
MMGEVTGQRPFEGSTNPCSQVKNAILRRPAEG